jgi:bifunctional DNA-binding transcriptional regulator/antitoxin component of YhaV-PrlF toxin-antitoxin module
MVVGKVLARGQVTLPGAVRRAAGIQADDVVAFEVTGPGTVEIRRLPRLTMSEALERYRIDVPIDLPADRAAWEARAAEDVLGQESS